MSNEHILQMGIHNVSREEYGAVSSAMDEAERAQERIAELERNLAYYKEQARLYQNDSMQIIYAAQQVDPLLYLVEDASAVPVMQRVLERLAEQQRRGDALAAAVQLYMDGQPQPTDGGDAWYEGQAALAAWRAQP
jgi:phage shock protein A